MTSCCRPLRPLLAPLQRFELLDLLRGDTLLAWLAHVVVSSADNPLSLVGPYCCLQPCQVLGFAEGVVFIGGVPAAGGCDIAAW